MKEEQRKNAGSLRYAYGNSNQAMYARRVGSTTNYVKLVVVGSYGHFVASVRFRSRRRRELSPAAFAISKAQVILAVSKQVLEGTGNRFLSRIFSFFALQWA